MSSATSRPEHAAPAEVFYNRSEAEKYATSSRMVSIQSIMANRCIEMLMLPPGKPSLVLDIGCGSGLSGAALSAAGHAWIGLDISQDMMTVGLARGTQGDMLLSDMGQGFGFRPGMFDACISVSAVQWLCHQTVKNHVPRRRLKRFFTSLYRALKRGARAVLQVYPEGERDLELMTGIAAQCGFTGGVVIDFPHSTKAKKYYLCLFAGRQGVLPAAQTSQGAAAAAGGGDMEDAASEEGLGGDAAAGAGAVGMDGLSVATGVTRQGPAFAIGSGDDPGDVREPNRRRGRAGAAARGRVHATRKHLVMKRKDKMRRRGKSVKTDSKYSGRKRKDKF